MTDESTNKKSIIKTIVDFGPTIIFGALVTGIVLYGGYTIVDAKWERDKQDRMPAIIKLNSAYHARKDFMKKAYNFQLDSIKNAYESQSKNWEQIHDFQHDSIILYSKNKR